MSFRSSSSLVLLSSLLLAAASAACGGATANDPTPGDVPGAKSSVPGVGSTTPGDPGAPGKPAKPSLPVGPFSGLVGTTDVSILYPLPLAGASKDFVRPAEEGNHGALLPRSAFDAVLPGGNIERVHSDPPSGYETLGVVSLRLDLCSSRGNGPSLTGPCHSEVRVVFQPLYEKAAGVENDPIAGSAATDGGLHVMYDVPEAELVVMMKQILTLKKANGDLALHELAPHPILVAQGLGGAFALGLRAILLEHLGDTRIARITFFDHNFDPDGDGWRFGVFDRTGATFTAAQIPVVASESLLISGSNTTGPLAESSAEPFSSAKQSDAVGPLVSSGRPAPGSAGAGALQASLDAALNVQNPKRHTAETTDCGNCHLAEGARMLGEGVYGLSIAKQFTHARSLARVDQRTSVTNLHAFGYLHRQISIMQRTANESVLVAEQMEAKLQ